MNDEIQASDEIGADFDAELQQVQRAFERQIEGPVTQFQALDLKKTYSRHFKAEALGQTWYIKELQAGDRTAEQMRLEVLLTEYFSDPTNGGGEYFTQAKQKFTLGDRTFLIYPEYQGGSLNDRIRKRDWLNRDELVLLVKRMGHALQIVHGRNSQQYTVFFRDFNPGNILYTTDQQQQAVPLLHDFGNAACEELCPDTDEAMSRGTPLYMAHESVFLDQYAVRSGKKGDVFSFGVVLYRLLTKGGLPYLPVDEHGRDPYQNHQFKSVNDILQFRRDNTSVYSSLSERGLQGSPEFNRLVTQLDLEIKAATRQHTHAREGDLATLVGLILSVLEHPDFGQFDAWLASSAGEAVQVASETKSGDQSEVPPGQRHRGVSEGRLQQLWANRPRFLGGRKSKSTDE